MSTEQIGVISSALYVGMVIGALVGGWLSDRVGASSSAGVGHGHVLARRDRDGVRPRVRDDPDFALRDWTRLQAATSVLLVYVAEMFPRHARGRFLSLVTMGLHGLCSDCGGIGHVLPAYGRTEHLAVPVLGRRHRLADCTRRVFLSAGVSAVVRLTGKLEHAAQIVATLEARALCKGPLDEPHPSAAQGGAANATLRDLLRSKAVLRNLIVLFVSYFGVYLAYYTWINWSIYALVYGLKYPQKDAYFIMFIWVVVYGVMPFIAMRLLDRWERKNTILCMSVSCALALGVLGLSTSYWAVAVIGGALAVFSGFVLNAYYTYILETMPTQLRALGNGIVMSGARVGGVVSGVMGAALVTAGGLKYVTWTAAAIYIAFAIPVLIFGPRTTNRSLEAVADEELEPWDGRRRRQVSHARCRLN
ncbi:MFS transporter [Cupriavidus basilensis]